MVYYEIYAGNKGKLTGKSMISLYNMNMEKHWNKKYLSYRELKECGYDLPYSFLMKSYLKVHHALWFRKRLNMEKEYLDRMYNCTDTNIVLDDVQRKVIVCEEDHIFIVAGAGSGKTTTIVAKVKYLIERKKILPECILVITYTNQAVNELKKRFGEMLDASVKVMTFHKFCFDLVQEHDDDYYVCEDDREIVLVAIFEWKQEYQKKYEVLHHFYYVEFELPVDHPQSFLKKCQKFISQFLELGYVLEDFILWKKRYSSDPATLIFLDFIEWIYIRYLNILKENDMITFPQMIRNARDILMTQKEKFSYEYVFVDEFQDISKIRYQVIRVLMEKFQVKTICVGDDFQAIYSFAGSDVNFFFEQINYAHGMEVFYIVNTYRNSQQLIKIAGEFIMKNKFQLTKQLRSLKKEKCPITLFPYQGDFIFILRYILKEIYMYDHHAEVLFLGRYQFDEKMLWETELFTKEEEKMQCNLYPTLNISFYTVHQSKGLGFDEVILLNGSKGRYGFPTEVKEDRVDRILRKNGAEEQWWEERRLFYVALTRTKHKVYILYPKYRASAFVKEIQKKKHVETKWNVS